MDGWKTRAGLSDDVCYSYLQDVTPVRHRHCHSSLGDNSLPAHRASGAPSSIVAGSAMTNTESRSAAFPWLNGRPTHLPCDATDVMPSVLLPGDPDRVSKAAGILDHVTDVG